MPVLRLCRHQIVYLQAPPFVFAIPLCVLGVQTDIVDIVYIYRVVLDSVNGVSFTRSTSMAAITFTAGEVRQLQFVDDNTLMILYSNSGKWHNQPSYPSYKDQ